MAKIDEHVWTNPNDVMKRRRLSTLKKQTRSNDNTSQNISDTKVTASKSSKRKNPFSCNKSTASQAVSSIQNESKKIKVEASKSSVDHHEPANTGPTNMQSVVKKNNVFDDLKDYDLTNVVRFINIKNTLKKFCIKYFFSSLLSQFSKLCL